MTYTAIAVVAARGAVVARPLGGAHPADQHRRTWWTAYGIIVVFQLLTNGWLTGRGIVRYDPDTILGSGRVVVRRATVASSTPPSRTWSSASRWCCRPAWRGCGWARRSGRGGRA